MKKQINHSGYLRVLAFVIPYFFSIGIFQLIAYSIAKVKLLSIDEERTTIQQLIIALFSCIGSITIVWIFTKYVDKEKLRSIGIFKQKLHKDLIIGFLIGSLSIAFGTCILFLTQKITFVSIHLDLIELIYTVILFSLVAIGEEIVFRAYVLKNLLISFNKYVALFSSSILFSLMHFANPYLNSISVISLLFAGLLFGITYIQSKSIWMPITIHLSWNLFQTIFGYNVSGISSYKLFAIKITGEPRFTGGNFGFEGSIYSIVIQGIVIVFFIYLLGRQKQHIS